ncbi:replication initiation protein RepC [Rhizobium aethiopicum]|uniref:plasmid replication protein RepC n=1 Tax=Rhizobium aethiopicum TaxID=1138170 RepID=UPI00161F32EA|nr:plasmid replication protein RepC [Rhizobium aethiopicum]MBB4581561.1 replication initiation protein RepC [Rhizobium aethiopicum]
MTQSGWRKPTPGLCEANAHAKAGERVSVSKNQAMLAVKRVAPAIGLKAGDLMLLDTLVVFTKACDWEEGARPIVWPSNDYLVENTGLSLSALKRHLRRLAETGVISYKDSSNGKRWGRRDDEGRIIEAYGFDLSPLAARVEKFQSLYASIQAERHLVKDLRRKITIMRRTVWAMLESELALASGFWRTVRQRYEALVSALQRCGRASGPLFGLCEAFGELKNDAEEAFRALGAQNSTDESSTDCEIKENNGKMDPREALSGPHIPITNHPKIVKGNSIENAPAARGTQSGKAEPVAGPNALLWEADPTLATAEPGTYRPEQTEREVTIETIMMACPFFAEMAHGLTAYVRNWRDFINVAEKIRPIIGISGDAWTAAQKAMGRQGAAAAVALITDKYSEGLVVSPGGYLRGLSLKAERGDLHLARSIFGRMSERHASVRD